MKKNNIAIIGLGYWGTIVTNTLISLSVFKNIFIYDNDNSKVKIIKKKFGNKVISTNLSKIKKDEKIKNIFLATPPKKNFSLLKSLINAKKNILIEKPGMTKLSQFNQIKKMLKKKIQKLALVIFIYIIIILDI